MVVSDPLVDAIHRAAADLPPELVVALADALEPLSRPGPDAVRSAFEVNSAGPYRRLADGICSAWERTSSTLPGIAVAIALRSALAAVAELAGKQEIDLVWTGPTSPLVAVSKSLDTLLRVINASTSSLWLMSFVTSSVRDVSGAIMRAAERGVDVRIVLETEETSRGHLDYDTRRAFDELEQLATFLVWPAERRPPGYALMHAKAALADRRVLLVTSANLTGAAVDYHIELGLLVTGGPVPLRLDAHLRTLIAEGVLAVVT